MADLSKTVSIIFQGVNNTGTALNGVADGLDKIGTEAGQAAPQISKVGEEAEKLGESGQGIDTLIGSLKALAGAVVIKEFVDANIEAEKFNLAMTQIKGSTELAAQEFEYIKGVANTLGLEINSTANAYIGFSAATKGTLLEGEQTREVFEAVSKAMATLGRSSADTEGALNALGQMVSKGTVSMEELRQQLGDRLYGAFQTAAAGMGLTTEQLNDLVSSGNLAATDFLPKFAAELKKTYGQTEYVDTFVAGSSRLKNALQELYQVVGQETGGFQFLVTGANVAATAVKAGSQQVTDYKAVFSDLVTLFRTGNFAEVWDNIQIRSGNAAVGAIEYTEATRSLRDEFNRLEKEGYEAADVIEQGFKKASLTAPELEKAVNKVDSALKKLGIDPKQFKDPIDEIVKAFEEIASNPAATGDQFLAGFLVTLKAVNSQEGINKLSQQLVEAFERGTIGADKLAAGLSALEQKQDGTFDKLPDHTKKVDDNTDALKKQKEETDKATEAAQKYALEMEKLASNERIKALEFKAEIDIAQIEADVKKFEAIFASIDNTVNATSKNIGDLFKVFSEGADKLTFDQLRKVEEQIEKENKLRDDALSMQKDLTKAQIEEIRARTESLKKGDALIKVDGAGLQPHLEAFMWEILKAVQVKVNSDGLEMLLGGTLA